MNSWYTCPVTNNKCLCRPTWPDDDWASRVFGVDWVCFPVGDDDDDDVVGSCNRSPGPVAASCRDSSQLLSSVTAAAAVVEDGDDDDAHEDKCGRYRYVGLAERL